MMGRPPKDDDKKVTRRPLDHEWIDVEDVPYSGFVPNLPPGLPARTREVWRSVSRMPHCALWTTEDWEFAVDTMLLHAAFAGGDFRKVEVMGKRFAEMGATSMARRQLRIRYIDPQFNTGTTAGPEIADISIERKRRLAS